MNVTSIYFIERKKLYERRSSKAPFVDETIIEENSDDISGDHIDPNIDLNLKDEDTFSLQNENQNYGMLLKLCIIFLSPSENIKLKWNLR